MPRTKIQYEPIEHQEKYSTEHWDIFYSKRNSAKQITRHLHKAGFRFFVYGSVARGDVKLSSDLDIILFDQISSFQIEIALEQSNVQIIGKEIVQATPGDAIKGHIFLPNETAVTFFLSNANEVSYEFYRFGGAIDHKKLESDMRVPGVTKALTLILPNKEGHRELNLIGNESIAQKILGVHPKIIRVRKRVLLKRDKTGRTGVFLKKLLNLNQNFEEELKKIADSNPIVKRKIL
jgi:uncharacterized protein